MIVQRIAGRVTLQIGLILWTVLVAVPFVLIVLLSFRSNADIFLNGLGLGGALSVKGYADAWVGQSGNGGMSLFFVNSAVVAATALLVSLGAGVTGAYFVTHARPVVRRWYLRIFILATVLPVVMLIVPLYQVYNSLGFISAPVAVGVAYGALTLPTTTLISYAYFEDFPKELTEAAAIDGIGPWRTYLLVVLPLARGSVTAVGILTLVFVWGETQLGVVLLQSEASQTIPVGLLSFQGQFTANLGAMFAGLALGSIPIMILYLLLNRQITKGIALGGFGGR